MTKIRKIGISLSFALIFMLLCMCVIPLYANNNANASVATISAASTWENPYDDAQHNNYYKNLNTNQTGSSFYNDLATLITNTHKKQISYDDLKDVYKTTDADPDHPGNVIWFYTGNSVPYTGAMDTGSYPTNREHVWPKMGGSAFPEKSQAGSDAHHVRPLNTGLNNTRSNYHFGETPQINKVLQSGSLSNYGTSDPDSWCYLDTVNGNKLFYPAKGYRGATARILFYLQTRWGKTSNLSFTLGVSSTKVMSNVDILLKWHLQEPPTEEEIRRNNLVEGVQGNRNPFIDHPEFAEMIYCNDGQSYNNALKNVVSQYGSYLNGNVNHNPGGNTGGGGTTTPGDFAGSLAVANSATTLDVRYTALDQAITLFNAMSTSEQSANREALQAAIDKYNQDIAIANDQLKEGTNVASQAVAKTLSMVFLAIVLIGVKQTVGR